MLELYTPLSYTPIRGVRAVVSCASSMLDHANAKLAMPISVGHAISCPIGWKTWPTRLDEDRSRYVRKGLPVSRNRSSVMIMACFVRKTPNGVSGVDDSSTASCPSLYSTVLWMRTSPGQGSAVSCYFLRSYALVRLSGCSCHLISAKRSWGQRLGTRASGRRLATRDSRNNIMMIVPRCWARHTLCQPIMIKTISAISGTSLLQQRFIASFCVQLNGMESSAFNLTAGI